MTMAQSSLKDFQKLDLVELRSLIEVETEEEADVVGYAREIFSGLVLKVRHFMLMKQAMKPMVFKTAEG
jgi:hypothetical protein